MEEPILVGVSADDQPEPVVTVRAERTLGLGERGVVTLSSEEFQFLYDTFEQLTSVYSDNDHIAEAIRTENEIWKMLQQIEARRFGAGS
jgi:hypothetical protein